MAEFKIIVNFPENKALGQALARLLRNSALENDPVIICTNGSDVAQQASKSRGFLIDTPLSSSGYLIYCHDEAASAVNYQKSRQYAENVVKIIEANLEDLSEYFQNESALAGTEKKSVMLAALADFDRLQKQYLQERNLYPALPPRQFVSQERSSPAILMAPSPQSGFFSKPVNPNQKKANGYIAAGLILGLASLPLFVFAPFPTGLVVILLALACLTVGFMYRDKAAGKCEEETVVSAPTGGFWGGAH